MRPIEKKRFQFERRARRVRGAVFGTPQRPRLSVYRSLTNIYAQIIDDMSGRTLAAASTRDKTLRDKVAKGGNAEAAKAVGKALAEAARDKGINQVVFDRRGYRYHGRIKALADAAREAGLQL